MVQFVRETSTTLRIVVSGAFVLAFMFCVSGIWLVYLGATGATEFNFFGQTFKSANVGIAALFLGAVSVVLLLRRALQTLDTAIHAETLDNEDIVPPGNWPRTRTLKSLELKIKTLSETQLVILMAIEDSEGMSPHQLADGLRMGVSMFYHRLSSLSKEELITMTPRGVYLAPRVKRLLKRRKIRELRG